MMANLEGWEPVNKTDKTEAVTGAAVIIKGIGSVEGVLIELLRASAASPIIAAATIVIITDILAQNKTISADAQKNLNSVILALTTVSALEGVFKSGIQTLVYAETGGLSEAGIGALLGSATATKK